MRASMFICTLLFTAIFSACTTQNNESVDTGINKSQLTKANFLLGDWHNITPEGILTESWKQLNDSVFAGRSYFVTGNDTSFSETIRLEQRKNGLYYIPTVSDQNSGKAVEFKLTSASAAKLAFENPEHDFPSKITYTLITKDSILALISGEVNGEKNTQTFPLKRSKL